MQTFTYLALGDSYTIGEGVPVYENYPYQTVYALRRAGYAFHAPEIVARTGWTTDELQQGIEQSPLLSAYDFVSLLIGVNNQYRGKSVSEYAEQFEQLLTRAIAFAGGNRHRVFVLSIPDWGVTPFAADRDRKAIAAEIDAFNATAIDIAEKNNVRFLDITPGTREAAHEHSLLVADQLHLSGKEYARWAQRLSGEMMKPLK